MVRPEQVPQLYRSAAERSGRVGSARSRPASSGPGVGVGTGGVGSAAAAAAAEAEVGVSAHTNRVLLMARKHSENASVRPRGARAFSTSGIAGGPGAGSVGMASAPFSSDTGVSHAVDCGERTHAFCWECGIEPHEPASCLHFKLWLEKICEIKPDQRALCLPLRTHINTHQEKLVIYRHY